MPEHLSKAKTVTDRDRRLLHWIGTNGVASFKQLHTVFWPTANERTCRERLVQLEKAGWIERHYVHTSRKRGEQVYTLTRRCATEHFEAATRKRLMIGLPATSELKQQLTAQDTRIVLDRMLAAQGKQVVNWLNERELRSEAAYLKRKTGSRAWGGLAGVADARVFIGSTGTLRSASGVPVEKTLTSQGDNRATFVNTVSTDMAILSSTPNQKSWGNTIERLEWLHCPEVGFYLKRSYPGWYCLHLYLK